MSSKANDGYRPVEARTEQSPRRLEEAAESFVSTHALVSKQAGDSEIERVTRAIEKRRKDRIIVTHDVQVALLQNCRRIAIERNYDFRSKIHISDLLQYRNQVREQLEREKHSIFYYVCSFLGFRHQSEQLCKVLDRAADLVQGHQGASDPYFHYLDFHAYYTEVESRWPWMRGGPGVAILYVFLFYLFTPLFFCVICHDPGVCKDEIRGDQRFPGWANTLYFASASLSTVGYGDITVSKSNDGYIFAGIMYMILANITLISSFSVAAQAGAGWNPMNKFHEKVIMKLLGEYNKDELLYKTLRRLKILRVTELCGGFITLILVGAIANWLFLLGLDEAEQMDSNWTWMLNLYWAVQTTTTIGYGDIDQPINMRWFQIFYLVFSTYFVGQALRGLAGLSEEIEQVKREHAWGRREISKNLIDELQPDGHDGKVDQYEFLVASLVQLGKLSSEDVGPIMDKFRLLAGDDGYITQKPEPSDESDQDSVLELPEDAPSQRFSFQNQQQTQTTPSPYSLWQYLPSSWSVDPSADPSEVSVDESTNNPVLDTLESGRERKAKVPGTPGIRVKKIQSGEFGRR